MKKTSMALMFVGMSVCASEPPQLRSSMVRTRAAEKILKDKAERDNVDLELSEAAFDFYPNTFDKIRLEPLKEGVACKLINENYEPPRISVLRKSFSRWTKERRKREYDIAAHVARSKAGPQIKNITDDYWFMELEYFNGGVVPYKEVDLKKLATSLRQLHSIGLPSCMENETQSTTFDRMRRQSERLISEYGVPEDFLKQVIQDAQEDERKMSDPYTQRVLCHLDLNENNIMKHDDAMKLIDFGMTGPDHPYLDLANFAMYAKLSPEQEMEFLAHYEQVDTVTPQIKKDYYFFRYQVYLNKITWPLTKAIRSKITIQEMRKARQEDNIFDLTAEYFPVNTRYPVDTSAVEKARYAAAAFTMYYKKRAEYHALIGGDKN